MADEIPKIMTAAALRTFNDLRVEQVPVPEPVSQEVLVKVHACAICGTDPTVILKKNGKVCLYIMRKQIEDMWMPSIRKLMMM